VLTHALQRDSHTIKAHNMTAAPTTLLLSISDILLNRNLAEPTEIVTASRRRTNAPELRIAANLRILFSWPTGPFSDQAFCNPGKNWRQSPEICYIEFEASEFV
jgi:hypothetical protein